MSSPAISVLMPVRDGAPTLAEALDSVLESREVDLELVCVDDGSRDETPAILDERARRDPRVHVLRAGRCGIVSALNTGLEASRGDRVARMDADDAMHPRRLLEQAEYLEANPRVSLVGCQVESFRDGGLAPGYRIYTEWVNGLTSQEAIAREAFVECPIPHPTWMFRRAVVTRLGGYRENGWPEDLDLLYRLMVEGEDVAKIPRPLHRWRDHPGRLSRCDVRYGRDAFLRAKAHYIGLVHPMPGAVIWGAGRTGRRWARLLAAEGVPIHAFIDVNPGRIGTYWHQIPILSPGEIGSHLDGWRSRGLKILSAVASRGARHEIRAALRGLSLREGADFLMVA